MRNVLLRADDASQWTLPTRRTSTAMARTTRMIEDGCSMRCSELSLAAANVGSLELGTRFIIQASTGRAIGFAINSSLGM